MKMGGPRQRNTNTKTLKEFRELQQNQQVKQQQKPQHRPREVIDEHGVPYIVSSSQHRPWAPSSYTAFKLILAVRLAAAIWSIVSDCDETYNYWEPTHFLLYGKGFQTWEYSPDFALRSYLYVLTHTVPAWIYAQILQPNRMYVFYFLRCLLALACSLCELYFYKGVRKEVGTNVARITLAFTVFSAGMFSCGTSYLPSTTSMYLVMLSHGAWLNQSYALAVFATAFSTFMSWPFAVILGIPIAIDLVFRRKRLVFFVRWCMISLLVILGPLIIIDSQYYGQLTFAPFNIIKYNIFTSHGPDLYGTEPWYFYMINGCLNFNIVFPAALLVWPVCLVTSKLISLPKRSGLVPVWLMHFAMYLWLAVFIVQPHKEERFLFPIYPLICLAAAAMLDHLQKLFFHIFIKVKSKHYLDHTTTFSIATIIVFGLASLSRVMSVYNNYHASMDVWMHVSHLPYTNNSTFPPGPVNVCTGKEWYRFPSSFFLPNNDWHLRFLRSEFKGQLPAPYPLDQPGGAENATKVRSRHFNDQNREEPSLYFTDVKKCDYIIDRVTDRATILEPDFVQTYPDVFEEEASFEFLDSEASDRIYRAFYVPFLSSQNIKFTKYVLLKNKIRENERNVQN